MFENNDVLATNEAADATQILQCALYQGARLPALHHSQMRQLRILRREGNAMIPPRLFRQRGSRLETVFAQPQGRGPCPRRHAAHAQQLQQGLAARHGLIFQDLLFLTLLIYRRDGLLLGFFSHDPSPDPSILDSSNNGLS